MKKLLASLLLSVASISVYAQSSITGAGATFPAPIYAKWAASYNLETGVRVNYTPVGSSGGITQINKKTVDFGATDDPVSQEQLQQNKQYQFPTVIGGLVAIFNIKGITANSLVLSGQVLADIYEGKITNWNDQQISKLNPSLQLPNLAITVVTRSDGSGTTAVFTDYLSKVSDSFRKSTGVGKTVNWLPKTIVAGRGNAGVSAMVTQISGSIGYVEYAFAKQAKIPYSSMLNKNNIKVVAGDESFANSAKEANWNVPGMSANLNNLSGWPIVSATFIIVYEKDHGNVKAVANFVKWIYEKGDKEALDLDYVPLPKNVKDKVLEDFVKMGFLNK